MKENERNDTFIIYLFQKQQTKNHLIRFCFVELFRTKQNKKNENWKLKTKFWIHFLFLFHTSIWKQWKRSRVSLLFLKWCRNFIWKCYVWFLIFDLNFFLKKILYLSYSFQFDLNEYLCVWFFPLEFLNSSVFFCSGYLIWSFCCPPGGCRWQPTNQQKFFSFFIRIITFIAAIYFLLRLFVWIRL